MFQLEAASVDKEAAEKFLVTLKELIEKEGYLPQQASINKTGLLWKKMPEKCTLAKKKRQYQDLFNKKKKKKIQLYPKSVTY